MHCIVHAVSLGNDRSAQNGQTALHWAALRGREACVQLLLDKGADPNARDQVRLSKVEAMVCTIADTKQDKRLSSFS